MAATASPADAATMLRLDAEQLAEATPATRDRVVDFLRVFAVGVVVVGHWLMAAVTWDSTGVHGRNVLTLAPWAQWLTWPFQVMPIVFIAGGAANAASWASAERNRTPYGDWLQARLGRLVPPTAALVAAWATGLAVARGLGADPDVLAGAGRLIGMPLWFLAVYVAVVAATPLAAAAHQRWGIKVTAALVALAGLADLVATTRYHALAWTSFAWVWLLAHDLGLWWRDGVSRRIGRWAAAGGLAAITALTTVGGYPRSMIGLPGQRSNMTPPTLPMAGIAVMQFGILVLLRPTLDRWLRRPHVWRRVVVANGVVMTTYLWHMTALAFGVIALLPTGAFPQTEPATGAWWALRPLWLLALTALTVPLVLLWAPVEARRPRKLSLTTSTAIALVAGLSVALTYLALEGVPVLPTR